MSSGDGVSAHCVVLTVILQVLLNCYSQNLKSKPTSGQRGYSLYVGYTVTTMKEMNELNRASTLAFHVLRNSYKVVDILQI